MADERRRFYGVQFHPEVTHTRQGAAILERFVREICGCEARWTAGNIIEDLIARVRAQVGDERVLLGLSGGVDSSVVAALLHRAIGAQLTCVFVDHGLLRLGEGDQVMRTFADALGVQVIRVDAEQRFLDALRGADRPGSEAQDHRPAVHRGVRGAGAQAARYALPGAGHDLSGRDRVGRRAHRQGARHQVASQRRRPAGGPEAASWSSRCASCSRTKCAASASSSGCRTRWCTGIRFPGPGLAVRILGEVKREYAELLRRADHIFIEELRRHELYERTSQAFAVFLPVRSVGVMGDGRRYDYVIALRAVETIDFMTAHWAHLPYEFLDLVSRRIVNEVPGISRVVYDISGKPPATIEWE